MPLFSCGLLLNRLISEARWEDARTPEKPFKRFLLLQENRHFCIDTRITQQTHVFTTIQIVCHIPRKAEKIYIFNNYNLLNDNMAGLDPKMMNLVSQ